MGYQEGIIALLMSLPQFLTSGSQDLIEETFVTLNRRPIPTHLVQRLSRMADAFVKNDGNTGRVGTA